MKISLSMTQAQHAWLRDNLFTASEGRARAIGVCGQRKGASRTRLLVHRLRRLPDSPEACISAEALKSLFHDASDSHLSVVIFEASRATSGQMTDGLTADLRVAREVLSREVFLGEVQLTVRGTLTGRVIARGGVCSAMSNISVIGDDIVNNWNTGALGQPAEFTERHAQAFGAGTTTQLHSMSAAVVGCSGTGSPVIEQLARLGVGRLVLVDPDVVEVRNINRIIHATMADAAARRKKVEVIATAIERMGIGTLVTPISATIFDRSAIAAVAECDMIFGCLDTIEGRHWLNRIATFYLQPYFDVGVYLEADGIGGINQICGTVHYVQPGRSSLLGRGQYTLDELHAEGLRRTNPEAYADNLKRGYIVNVPVDRPAVVSVNMHFASLAVNELLARIHPYRDDPNGDYAIHRTSLSQGHVYHEAEPEPCSLLAKFVGRGDMEPLLDLPALS